MDYKTYDPDTEGYGNARQWRKAFNFRIDPEEAHRILQEEDPYYLLGISRMATQAEIKKAFREKAMQWHPDKNPDNLEYATEMMKKLNAAYSLLIK